MNADAIVLASYTRQQTSDFDVGITPKGLQSQCAVLTATPAEYDAQCLPSLLIPVICDENGDQDINPDAAGEDDPSKTERSRVRQHLSAANQQSGDNQPNENSICNLLEAFEHARQLR